MVTGDRTGGVAPDRLIGAAVERLIDVKSVAVRLDVSERMVWKLLASGRFPQPVRVGRSVKWRESDVDRFIAGGCSMREFAATGTAADRGRA